MKIGELAQLSGLTASRIRFYEAAGLITAVERKTNGYRDYSPDALWMLEMIASAQSAGFTLEQTRHLLPVGPGNWQYEALLEALRQKVAEIEVLQKRLKQSKAQLLVAIESIENRPEEVKCADRPKWVLERLRENKDAPAPGKVRSRTAG